MKKFLALLLALAVLLSLAACGSGSGSKKDDDDDKDSNKLQLADFETITVVDNDDITIEITDVEKDRYWLTLSVSCENKSDLDLTFTTNSATVCGILLQYHGSLWEEVSSGKKANSTIEIDLETLEEYGVENATDILLDFNVYDSEEYDDVYNGTARVYPYGEQHAYTYEYKTDSDDVVLVDNDYCTVIITGYEEGDYFEDVTFYIKNKTSYMLCVESEDTSVNDYMSDSWLYSNIPAGLSTFDTLSIDAEWLEDMDIDKVENVEFTLTVSNADDWSADDLFVDDFIYEP